MAGDRLSHVLGIQREHPDQSLMEAKEVDDTQPASFSAPRRPPSQLPHSTRSRDDGTRFWIVTQLLLQLPVVLIGKILAYQAREEWRLNKGEHGALYVRDVYQSRGLLSGNDQDLAR